MLLKHLSLLTILACTGLASDILARRAQCASGYSPCDAEGSTDASLPAVGTDLRGLYTDIVDSVNAVRKRDDIPVPHALVNRDDKSPDLCCAPGMQCLLLQGVRISFCWDRFTTNYHFADGSYGSVTTGIYNTPAGDVADLIVGNYTLVDGRTGSIYAGNEDSKPNTSTMDLPPPFTAKGEGSAIPGSELGAPPTATGDAARTIPATTIPEATVSGSIVIPATTIPATTIFDDSRATVTATVTRDGAAPTAPNAGSSYLTPPKTGKYIIWIMMAITTALCSFI